MTISLTDPLPEGMVSDTYGAAFSDWTAGFRTVGQVYTIGNWQTQEMRGTLWATGYGEDSDRPGVTGDTEGEFR